MSAQRPPVDPTTVPPDAQVFEKQVIEVGVRKVLESLIAEAAHTIKDRHALYTLPSTYAESMTQLHLVDRHGHHVAVAHREDETHVPSYEFDALIESVGFPSLITALMNLETFVPRDGSEFDGKVIKSDAGHEGTLKMSVAPPEPIKPFLRSRRGASSIHSVWEAVARSVAVYLQVSRTGTKGTWIVQFQQSDGKPIAMASVRIVGEAPLVAHGLSSLGPAQLFGSHHNPYPQR